MVEGQPLLTRPVKGVAEPLRMASDGIAISPDGKRVAYVSEFPALAVKVVSFETGGETVVKASWPARR